MSTGGDRQETLMQWLAKQAAIPTLFAVFAAYGGYVTGQNSMTARIDRIERDLSRLEGRAGELELRAANRVPALACMVRSIDRLTEATGVQAPCTLEVPN